MTDLAYLRCRRCQQTYDLGPDFDNCPACVMAKQRGILEVDYDYARIEAELGSDFWQQRGNSIWQYGLLLPLGYDARPISLGEGNTPLLKSRLVGPGWGMDRLYFKNESLNPTWAHKDRFHTVAISLAKALGYPRVVTSSTGNHGASAAAYASVAGLDTLVLCPPQTSQPLLNLIQTYGARVIVTDWDARAELGRYLVVERGWYPATGFDPLFTFSPNPYGVEGYKTIAYELVRDLGRPPDGVFVPCASGDTFYGIWKGFKELQRLGRIDHLPRMYGCQPVGANVIQRSLVREQDRPVVLEHPYSIATSTRERSIGSHALEVIRESGDGAPVATDEEILKAVSWLGGEGLCAEPASAIPLACVHKLLQSHEIDATATVVCLITSAGIKWPDVLAQTTAEPPHIPPTIEALERQLAAFSNRKEKTERPLLPATSKQSG